MEITEERRLLEASGANVGHPAGEELTSCGLGVAEVLLKNASGSDRPLDNSRLVPGVASNRSLGQAGPRPERKCISAILFKHNRDAVDSLMIL